MKNKLVLLMIVLLMSSLAMAMEILGAGATFPAPLYSKMFDVYNKENGVMVNYQGIGSGGGIKQTIAKVIDFGGTDAFMTEAELASAGAPIVHIPTCLGAVVISYNLPGNPQLRFTPEVLSDIFYGKITKWNDERIIALNPGVELPAKDIFVAHRSDGSGTTSIFTDYLAKVNQENWVMDKAFKTKAKNALGGKGNSGVAGLIKAIPGTIGYIELAYAKQNKMPVAMLRNKSGNYVMPDLESITLAADTDMPASTRASITDTDAAEGYPICGFTWLVVYQEQSYNNRSLAQAEALKKLLRWVVLEGQPLAKAMDYGVLSPSVAKKALANIESMTYAGKSIN